MKLYREGKLLPEKKAITFGEFAAGWWDKKSCKYLEWRQVQNPLAPSTIDHYKTNLENHLKPCFGRMTLDSISFEAAQKWVVGLANSGYSNSSINIQIATLKVMMKEALRLKLISSNPVEKIKKLKADNSEVKILKTAEVKKLFSSGWNGLWESYEIYQFNKLAACTGMRPGELMGLKAEHIFPDHIHVCMQFSKRYGITQLKTKDSRNIPITGVIYSELAVLIKKTVPDLFFRKTEAASRFRVTEFTGKPKMPWKK